MTAEYKKYQDKRRQRNLDIDFADQSRGGDEGDPMMIEDDYFQLQRQVNRNPSREKSPHDLTPHSAINGGRLALPYPSTKNLTATEATQRQDGDTSVAPSANMASRGLIRNVGPGGEVVR
jgi:hypothetical protein